MVALAVVVLKVLPREEAQVALTQRDHTRETFLLDRPNKPFGIRVEIGTLRRQPNGLPPRRSSRCRQQHGCTGIAVVNEIARCPQETINRVRERAGHLRHPGAVRLGVDAGDLCAARFQLDHEEHKVPLETGQREHFDRKEVGSREAGPVPARTSSRRSLTPLRGRVDPVVLQNPLHRVSGRPRDRG